jgi:hypothetical protein
MARRHRQHARRCLHRDDRKSAQSVEVFAELRARRAGGALSRVNAPIGIDIAAFSPTEIAVSVLAEILAILNKKKREKFAGHRRHKDALICCGNKSELKRRVTDTYNALFSIEFSL